ncbi:MAG: sodium:solute symporter family protein [Spirochaetales bacterium]|nr:sodium:solute symporter family protein [Spirochaetales bacterium]
MNKGVIVVSVYLLLTLILGLSFRRRAGTSIREYYLAGSSIGGLLLFFTMSATNFSAFTIFGLSGAGYRMGYSFYPVMGFGTGFMVLSFILIGKRIRRLSEADRSAGPPGNGETGGAGFLTPSDYISYRYGSKLLKLLISGVLVFFTLPYIAIQAVAAGRSLFSLTGIPYLVGAFIISLFVIFYVFSGGLRSIIWTDLIQAVMMIGFTFTSFIIISIKSGGFITIHEELLVQSPELFTRSGTGGLGPGIWFSYLLLWFFADPMFPQLFQRFLAARDEKSLNVTIILYPLITTWLFFLTISIGVMGQNVFPDLPAGQSDSIFPLLLRLHAGELLGTILLTGSLAALMSTMDSQLLSISSLLQRDFLPGKWKGSPAVGRMIVLILGCTGFLIAVNPPAEILAFINKTTFNGLSVLTPAFIGGLYWKRAHWFGAVVSIIAGEILVLLFFLGVFEVSGMLPVIPILIVVISLFILLSLAAPLLLSRHHRGTPVAESVITFKFDYRLLFFLIPVAAGSDIWNWDKIPVNLFLGLPFWVWRYAALGILLSLAYKYYLKRDSH